MERAVDLGSYLRDGRQARGLSIEDLAAVTRISRNVLVALEAGQLDELPAPVYVRGFIRACCARSGVAAEPALVLYEERLHEAPDMAPPEGALPLGAQRRVVPSPWSRPLKLVGAIAGGTLVVVAVGLYLAASVAGTRPGPPMPGQSTRPATPQSPLPAALATAAPARMTGGRTLVMRAHDATWVRVRPDDAQPTEGLLQPGSVREWRATGRFLVTLGNAGGVSLELDGQVLPALGGSGEVVRDVTLPPGPLP